MRSLPPSQMNRMRYHAGNLVFRQQGPRAHLERHFHALASTTTTPSWHAISSHSHVRNFSAKNRKRKEEKRRKRQQEKEGGDEPKNEKKAPDVTVTSTTPDSPVVTQTKAKDDDIPEFARKLQEQGFTVAARPPDEEDDEEFVPRFAMPDKDKEKEITQLQTQVSALHKSGRYQQGMEMAQTVLETTLAHFGESHPATASSYLNVGLFHKQLGEFEGALKNYDKALEAYKETVGEDHESYAMVLYNKGILLQSRLHYDEELQLNERTRLVEQAMECLEEAYRIQAVELPKDHPHVVASQSAIGMTLTSHILAQHRRVSGQDKQNVVPGAAGYRSVLPAAVAEEAWRSAEGHLRDALQKATQNPKGDSFLKRTDKNHYLNLQKKYNLKQKIKKGEYLDDVEFPVQTASAATASQNLAIFLKARSTTVDDYHPDYQKWVKEAQDLYLKALEVRTALLPKGHPDIYATQHSLAELYDHTGQDELAEEMRQIILETYYEEEPSEQEEESKKAQNQV